MKGHRGFMMAVLGFLKGQIGVVKVTVGLKQVHKGYLRALEWSQWLNERSRGVY